MHYGVIITITTFCTFMARVDSPDSLCLRCHGLMMIAMSITSAKVTTDRVNIAEACSASMYAGLNFVRHDNTPEYVQQSRA